jgi:hypothetical protein
MNIYNDDRKLTGILNYKKALVFIAKYKDYTLLCKTIKFSGVRTIGKIICEDNQKFNLNLKVVKGKSKIIFVKNRKIYLTIENDYNGEIETNLESGLYKIRIVGESADLDLSFKKIVK